MPCISVVRLLFRPRGCEAVIAAAYLAVLAIWAAPASAQPNAAARTERCLTIEIYSHAEVPQEQALANRVAQILQERRGVVVVPHDITTDKAAADRLQRLASHFKLPAAAGPVVYGMGRAIVPSPSDAALRSQLNSLRRMEMYYRDGCPHCHAARQFLPQMQRRYPGLEVVYRDAVNDQTAIRDLQELAQRYRQGAATLPVFHFCGKFLVGFDRAETSGARLQQTLDPWTAPCPARTPDPAPPAPTGPRAMRPASNTPAPPSNAPPMARAPVASRKFHKGRIVVAALAADAARVSHTLPLERTLRTATSLRMAGRPNSGGRLMRVSQTRETATPAATTSASSDESASSAPAASDDPDLASGVGPPETAAPPSSVEPLPLPEPPAAAGELPLPLPDSDVSDGPTSFNSVDDDSVTLPLFGTITVRQLGLPLFTLAIGLVDGFNPCAMWVLVFLLSILVNLQSRWKILAVAGTFVVISGAAYFAFMAAWLNVFLWVGYLRWVQVILALLAIFVGSVHVKDFFAFHRGLTLSIPESAKPGIYARVRRIVTAENLTGAILGASVLAVLVNIVELLCTAGLPALYTQILSGHQFPWWKNYGYLLLYILAYMFDDTLMVTGVVCTMRKTRLQETQGRWLKLVSGLVILALGIVLLLRPEWLM